jgi:hypothetical protein
MDLIKQYIDLFSAAIGFLLGCGVTLTVQRLRLGKNANFSDQRGSHVGGDQAGRDLKK